MKAAVVGAGIAGVACARELFAAGHDVRVLDRGRVPGGRMASRELAGRPVDTGASYLTASDRRFTAVVDDWLARGLARPWTDRFHAATPDGLGESKQGPMRYGAPAGLRSLVEDLAAGLPVRHAVDVGSVGPGPTVDGEAYDVVVLAMPDPQALRLLDPSHATARLAIGGRAWEPALALVAGFEEHGWDLDGAFVADHPVLAWIADDGSRRGDGAPVLVAHSTPGFATPRLAAPEAATPEMTARLGALFDLPEPDWVRMQRWTYAKPVGTRDAPFAVHDGIGVCGDGWGASKVEAAWLSGHQLGAALGRSAG